MDRDISLFTAEILVLLIARKRYGREIRNEYCDRTGRKVAYGPMYTTLNRMVDAGLLKVEQGDSEHASGGNKRRWFKLTGKGARALDEFRTRATPVVGGLSHA